MKHMTVEMRPRTILILCFVAGVAETLVALRLSALIGAGMLIGTVIALFLIGNALQVAIVKGFKEQRLAATSNQTLFTPEVLEEIDRREKEMAQGKGIEIADADDLKRL